MKKENKGKIVYLITLVIYNIFLVYFLFISDTFKEFKFILESNFTSTIYIILLGIFLIGIYSISSVYGTLMYKICYVANKDTKDRREIEKKYRKLRNKNRRERKREMEKELIRFDIKVLNKKLKEIK